MDLIKSIQLLFQNSQYLLASVIIGMSFIILCILWFILRRNAKRRMDDISSLLSPGGIDYTALKNIQRTGLVSEEEMNVLKKKMADEYLTHKSLDKKKAPGRLPLEIELEQAEIEARSQAKVKGRKADGASLNDSIDAIDPLEFDAANTHPESVFTPSEKTPIKSLPEEQIRLLRKHLKWDELNSEEARRFHQMGVIDTQELAGILERERNGRQSKSMSDGDSNDKNQSQKILDVGIQPELLTLEELDKLYESGEIDVGQYEAWKWRVKS